MKILKTILKFFGLLLVLLIGTYLFGPRITFEKFDNIPLEGKYSLDEVISKVENRNNNSDIKDHNHEKVVWYNGQQKTKYSVIYLHGFSASHMEGSPVHYDIAKSLQANLYLSRLPYHGLKDVDAFAELTPKDLVEYAKDAVKIGKSIGDELIVISCSTGGTLSAYLSSNDPDIKAQVMFSPNFQLANQTASLLTKPWGMTKGRFLAGGPYRVWDTPPQAIPYWNQKYRLEGIAALVALLEQSMTEVTFENIESPTFIGYYYKNETEKDNTISISKILEVEGLLNTPDHLKVFKAYPEAGGHVFTTDLFNSRTDILVQDILEFLGKSLNIDHLESINQAELINE